MVGRPEFLWQFGWILIPPGCSVPHTGTAILMQRQSRDLVWLVLPPPLFSPQNLPAPAALSEGANGVLQDSNLQESNLQGWEVFL